MLRKESDAFRLVGVASVVNERGQDWKGEATCEQKRISIG
jgi:hypothetical protein